MYGEEIFSKKEYVRTEAGVRIYVPSSKDAKHTRVCVCDSVCMCVCVCVEASTDGIQRQFGS